jgi:hypothetical protein
MLGGAGADKFVYYGTQDGASSTLGSQDYIGDFDPSVDRLLINRGGFGIGGGEALTVNVDSNPSSITVSGAAVVIYARQTGNIYFDPDGATAGGAEPTLLATLTNTPTNLPSASVLFF